MYPLIIIIGTVSYSISSRLVFPTNPSSDKINVTPDFRYVRNTFFWFLTSTCTVLHVPCCHVAGTDVAYRTVPVLVQCSTDAVHVSSSTLKATTDNKWRHNIMIEFSCYEEIGDGCVVHSSRRSFSKQKFSRSQPIELARFIPATVQWFRSWFSLDLFFQIIISSRDIWSCQLCNH